VKIGRIMIGALLRRLRVLKQTGGTVLLSEQTLRFAAELADRVYLIEEGEIHYHGMPADLAGIPG
jgi:ABC-type branched-subunit amino acid transport system ATPase component